jgi:hypothetical protein
MDSVHADLQTLLIVWIVFAVAVLIRHWGSGRGVGLVFTYVLSIGVMHWMSAALYLLPWFPDYRIEPTTDGLRESVVAMVAFAIGSEVVLWLGGGGREERIAAAEHQPSVDQRTVNFYLLSSVVLYGVFFPIAHRLPSATALVSTGSTLIVVGIGLKCWNAWTSDRKGSVWLWLLATTGLPVVTVLGQGFLGYGFAAMLTVFAFVASFHRPRWRVLVIGTLLAYGGMSVYVTYMRDRRDIRNVVWAGAGLGDRVGQLAETFSAMEWFDVYNPDHLGRIDSRLNQDYLIGASVAYLRGESTDYAHGATFWGALVAVVPRAVWPNKPVAAGSGDLVSQFTGITFAEGTSVGIGQVMESYVNFGTTGVVVVFLVIGVLVATFDRFAARSLARGDAARFLLWYLPGLSLLQIGGSFVEVTSSAAAAIVVAAVLNHVTGRLYPDRRDRVRAEGAEPDAPAEVAR